jgi:hypothetical protein
MNMLMKIAALAAAALIGSAALAADAPPRSAVPSATKVSHKPFHRRAQCLDCHGEKAPVKPVTIKCDSCHGSPAEVAERTAAKYKKYYNPHDSLHHGTTADCVMCHREHSASRLDCNNANCHSEFKPQVP